MVAIGVAAGFALRWVTHPNVFAEYGSGVSGPASVGQAWTHFTGLDAGVEVTIVDVVPRVTMNTADADIRLRLCHSSGRNEGVGPVPGSAERACSHLTGLQDQTVTLMPTEAQVIAIVTPRRPGRVHIAGFTIRYRDGARRGSEHSGLEMRLRVSPG